MNVTPFDVVIQRIREKYSCEGSCLFDIFVKQADGQTIWEQQCWDYRSTISCYFRYVFHYPDRAVCITHYGKLVASAYWAEGDVHFKSFETR